MIDTHDSPELQLVTPLQTGSGAQIDLIGFGEQQLVWRFSLDSEGLISGWTEVVL